MQKNTAGQKVGAQMVSTAGAAFTGTVTVYVTLDAGSQAIGTVGSGVCTHEGNGYHTYAPSQAETNAALAAYTFIGTGAVPATVQIYTTGYDKTQTTVPTSDTSGVTTLLSRLSSLRAVYLDNLSAGAVALQSTLSTASTNIDAIPTNAELATALSSALAAYAAAQPPTESYASPGTKPTRDQFLFMILQFITEFSISGTTRTTETLGGGTAMTHTLNSSTAPTALARAT